MKNLFIIILFISFFCAHFALAVNSNDVFPKSPQRSPVNIRPDMPINSASGIDLEKTSGNSAGVKESFQQNLSPANIEKTAPSPIVNIPLTVFILAIFFVIVLFIFLKLKKMI